MLDEENGTANGVSLPEVPPVTARYEPSRPAAWKSGSPTGSASSNGPWTAPVPYLSIGEWVRVRGGAWTG